MLDKNIIKEAETNFRIYLNEGMIKKVKNIDSNIVKELLKNAKESLDMAEMSNKNNISPMWTIVCSYYCMFYVANCLLYVRGYKVGDKIAHKITTDSLIYLMRDKLKNYYLEIYKESKEDAEGFAQFKSDQLLENLNYERRKRSNYQYETSENIKISKSLTSLKRAKEFLFELRGLINKN